MATAARTRIQALATYKDRATRKSSVRFNVSSTDATAWATDTTTGAIKDAFDAIDGLTLDDSQLRRVARYFDDTGINPGGTPVNENAVNSAKLLALFVDTVTHSKFSMQIPARDGSAYTSSRGLVDIDSSTRTSQVDAFMLKVPAALLSEDGNISDCYEIRVIGKGTAA